MRILAHRGASGYAPENTFAAFDLALELHAHAIETDVRLTRDNIPVLIHDEKVDRTTTGTGNVADLAIDQLETFDAGTKFHPRFAGQKIPRAADFLHRYLHHISICLEVKTEAVVQPLLALLKTPSFAEHPNLEFTSFEWPVILSLHRALPRAPIGHLTRSLTPEIIDQVKGEGLTHICPPAKDVTPELIARCHSLNLTVRTWGVKTHDQLAHILSCKVDGTTLNHPDWTIPPAK